MNKMKTKRKRQSIALAFFVVLRSTLQAVEDEDDKDDDCRAGAESQGNEHLFALHLGDLEALEEKSEGKEAKLQAIKDQISKRKVNA